MHSPASRVSRRRTRPFGRAVCISSSNTGKPESFWYPMSTSSVTEARIFGTTEVTIRYFDYRPRSQNQRITGSAYGGTLCPTLNSRSSWPPATARLAARSGELPKPLVHLHGKPLLEHVIRGAHEAGIERFVIVVGYRGPLDSRVVREWTDEDTFTLPGWRIPSITRTMVFRCWRTRLEIPRAISAADGRPHL